MSQKKLPLIDRLVRKYFPKRQWGNAIRVATAENGSFNPKAYNHNSDKVNSIDVGLFQINDYWHYKKYAKTKKAFRKMLKNPEYNVKIASEIYKTSGFNAWSVVKFNKVKIK